MLRKLVPILAVLLLFAAIPAKPQTVTQQAVLSWTAASDAVASSTYNVYHASGACPASGLGTLTFTKLNATGISALTYTDSTLTVGTWCFYATQSQSGVESLPLNTAGGNVRPGTVTIQRGSFFPAIAPNEPPQNVQGIRCTAPVAKCDKFSTGLQAGHDNACRFGNLLGRLACQLVLDGNGFLNLPTDIYCEFR